MVTVNYMAHNEHREQYGRMHYKSLHSEMNSLFKLIKSEKKNRIRLGKGRLARSPATIYIVRLARPDGMPTNSRGYMYTCSKPCHNCEKYLYHYNITCIKYTDVIDGKNVLCEMRIC